MSSTITLNIQENMPDLSNVLKPGVYEDSETPGLLLPNLNPITNDTVTREFKYSARKGYTVAWDVLNEPVARDQTLSFDYLFGAFQNLELMSNPKAVHSLIRHRRNALELNVLFLSDLIPMPAGTLSHLVEFFVTLYHKSVGMGSSFYNSEMSNNICKVFTEQAC